VREPDYPTELKPPAGVPVEGRCHAGSDGDCWWALCPQEIGNRAMYQSWCPLASHYDALED
jgi:hypothetical protein